MKKSILLLLALIGSMLSAAAQDLVVKGDGSEIKAIVKEITTQEVRYKRFSNPDGPTYILPVGEIRYIQYANGEKDFFAKPEAIPAAPLTPASQLPVAATAEPVAAPAAANADAPASAAVRPLKASYEIGEYYHENGIEGVVCLLSEEGRHGLVISLREIYLPWSSFRKPDLRTIGANERSDGMRNMEIVARYIADNNLSWADFPAFRWCREMGEGWYLPSVDEMLMIGHNYNGGTRLQSNRQARSRFNDTLKEHGGDRMDRLVYYFSSTEMDEKNAYTTHMGSEPPYVIEIPKYTKFLVRAVHKF